MNTIFIPGEAINLCVPVEEDFDQWSSWFNSKETTKFLEQGKYPNTVASQKEFYKNALASGRLLLMIKTKSMKLLGVISLSDIDYEKSRCQIAIVCPEKSKEAPLAVLEAVSLLQIMLSNGSVLHDFMRGKAYLLRAMTKHLEIIGYKAEGFQRNGFKHGMFESDGVLISIVKQDYLKLIRQRNNVLWPGAKVAREMISVMKNFPSLLDELHEIINQRYVNFDERLEGIEKQIRLALEK